MTPARARARNSFKAAPIADAVDFSYSAARRLCGAPAEARAIRPAAVEEDDLQACIVLKAATAARRLCGAPAEARAIRPAAASD
jgi:hypothetical protein